MQKSLVLMMALAMTLSLEACGGGNVSGYAGRNAQLSRQVQRALQQLKIAVLSNR